MWFFNTCVGSERDDFIMSFLDNFHTLIHLLIHLYGPRATVRPATQYMRTARDELVGPRAV